MLPMFAWMSQKLKAVLGLVLPVYQKARGSGGMPRWLRVVLHVLVVAAILAGLFWINSHEEWIPDAIPKTWWIRFSWLPILFLLIYTLCWLSYWLWTLLVSDDEGPYFADIDAAWEEAKTALRLAGVGLTDQPLFLILGQPEDDEKALFQASKLTLEVKQAPSSPDAPLHVYATREAVYLTCAGASVLGCHARFLAGKLKLGDQATPGGAEQSNEDDDIINRTLSPDAKDNKIPNKGVFADIANMAQMFYQAEREGRPLAKLSKSQKRKLRGYYRKSHPHRSPLKDTDRIAEESARLQFLCQLVVRDRRPFCAVNGVLLLLPFAGCDSDQDAAYTAEALQRDLAVTTTALKVDCPHFALVCDLETADGFGDFLQHFTPSQRLQRLGQRCPLNPDLRDEVTEAPAKDGAARMLDSLAKWLSRSFMPTWIYRHFQMEKADKPALEEVVRGNGQLFLLGDELQERSKRLGTILSRGLAQKTAAGPLLFGGCYLAGTGSDPENEQGFVRGLMDRLDDEQSRVYWTRATLAEEARYAFWANLGWTVLALVLAGLVLLLAAFYLGWLTDAIA
jgi:hypothetical protein